MEENKQLYFEDLEQVSGGGAIEGMISFRTAIFQEGALLEVIDCCGVPTAPGNCVRISTRRKYGVNLENIHVYLPSGDEMYYGGNLGQSGVKEGDTLKVVLVR